jgi:8-oxo-dGTP pyrophosphatase MutT (NUDIX family)
VWLFTSFGFFSVVRKQGEPDLTIRSRARGDLLRLQRHYLPELSDPVAHEGTDYPWRSRCGHVDLARAMPRIVEHIDYANFKDEVALSNGKDRAHRYAKVWQALYGMDDDLPEPARESDQGLPWPEKTPAGKNRAFGGVVVDTRGRILLREVEGHYDGYVWTFAKGRPDRGESPRQAALREVKEEMGVDARILLPLPSSFTGGTTQTQFFLMVVDERNVEMNHRCKETSGLCWALPHEAERLISQTTNELGRERDLMVLAESMLYLPTPIPLSRPIARREDWGFRPMPAKRTVLNFQRIFTQEETAKLVHGFIAQAMEQKWCAYFEDGVLRIHRSWSGFEIFRLHMLPSQAQKGHWEVVKTELNRHPDQWTQSDRESLASLDSLIQELLVDYVEKPNSDDFSVAAIETLKPTHLGQPRVLQTRFKPFMEFDSDEISQLGHMGKHPNLASLTVVSELLRKTIGAAVDRRGDYLDGKLPAEAAISKDVESMRSLADLLNGKGPRAADYFIQPWNSPEQMGAYLKEAYDLECSEEEAAFTIVMSALNEAYGEMDAIIAMEGDPEHEAWRIEGIIELYAHALTGEPYPDEEA